MLVLGGTAGYMFIAILGAGGIAPFFSHPPLIALGMVLLTLVISAFVAGGKPDPGVREERGNGWVIAAVGVIGTVLRGRAR